MKRVIEVAVHIPMSRIAVPKGSSVLYVRNLPRTDLMYIGFLVNDEQPRVSRTFHFVGTDVPIDAQLWTGTPDALGLSVSQHALNTDPEKGPHWHYVGSVYAEPMLWHVFEERDYHGEY